LAVDNYPLLNGEQLGIKLRVPAGFVNDVRVRDLPSVNRTAQDVKSVGKLRVAALNLVVKAGKHNGVVVQSVQQGRLCHGRGVGRGFGYARYNRNNRRGIKKPERSCCVRYCARQSNGESTYAIGVYNLHFSYFKGLQMQSKRNKQVCPKKMVYLFLPQTLNNLFDLKNKPALAV